MYLTKSYFLYKKTFVSVNVENIYDYIPYIYIYSNMTLCRIKHDSYKATSQIFFTKHVQETWKHSLTSRW